MPKTIENGKTSRQYRAVTPHNTNALALGECSAIFVGVGGDVVLVDIDATEVTFKNVPSGGIIPCQTSIVKSTGTTATNIVALY